MKAARPTTIAGSSMKPPPPPDSIWERIETARSALGWNERKMGEETLDNHSHYTKIWERGWRGTTAKTTDKIVARLVQEDFSEEWLRAGTLPERGSGKPLPAPQNVSAKLGLLAQRLLMPEQQMMALWADLEGVGPLDKLTDEVQRAAFAAAYMEGRTLEDIRAAVGNVMRKRPTPKGIDSWLSEIRFAVRSIKPGSGTRPGLTLIPAKAE